MKLPTAMAISGLLMLGFAFLHNGNPNANIPGDQISGASTTQKKQERGIQERGTRQTSQAPHYGSQMAATNGSQTGVNPGLMDLAPNANPAHESRRENGAETASLGQNPENQGQVETKRSGNRPTDSCAWLVYGEEPVIPQREMPRTYRICHPYYLLLTSGITKTGIWSAEHLTRAQVQSAMTQTRINSFHAEAEIPASERAELSDYKGTGFDRGHLTPSGDSPDPGNQNLTFSLANMIPQTPTNNRGIWEAIEEATRRLAEQSDDLYVVTGPVFQGNSFSKLQNRVVVPNFIFKALYSPKLAITGVYVSTNDNSGTANIMSIDEFTRKTGIDPFPNLSAERRTIATGLPQPRSQQRYSSHE